MLAADAVVIEGVGVDREPRPTRRLAFVATLGALAGVLMLAGVGSLLLSGLSGGSGGADSPEQAVEELFRAIEGKDPLAVLATLSPTEVRSLGDVVQSLQGRIAEAGYPDAGSIVDGVELDITYDSLTVTPLSGDAAGVEVAGVEVSYTIDPTKFPSELRGVLEQGLDDLSGSLTPDDGWGPLQVVAVRDGAGWYVSPLYSGIEHALAREGRQGGDFAAAAERPTPPADAEALVEQWVAAVEAVDVRAALDLLSFDALGLGQVYGEAIDGAIADLGREAGAPLHDVLRIDIEDVQFSQRDEGDLVHLTVERLRGSASVTVPDDGSTTSVSFSFDGTCYELAWDGETEQHCTDEQDPLRSQPVVVLVREDGGVRVSPVATMAHQAMAALDAFDPSESLSFFGLSHLQPPAAHLEQDQPVTVELDRTGSAVVTFDAAAGQVVTFEVGSGDDPSASYEVWSPTSEPLYCYGPCELTETGTHRLVVTSWSGPEAVEVSFHVEG